MVASLVTFYSFNCILCLRSHSLLQVLYFDNNYKGYLFNQKISHQFYCIAKTCWENMIKNVDIWNHVQMLIVYWHKLTLFRYNKPDSLYMWKCVCVCVHTCTHMSADSVTSDSLHPHELQPARLLCPWNFPGKKYWSGFPFPTPVYFPHPEIEPASLGPPALTEGFFTTEAIGKPMEAFR